MSNYLVSEVNIEKVSLRRVLLLITILIMIALCSSTFQAEANQVYVYLTESNLKLNEYYLVFVQYTEKSNITGYPIIGHKDIHNYALQSIDYDFHENDEAFVLDPGNKPIDDLGLTSLNLIPLKSGAYNLILKLYSVDPNTGKFLPLIVATKQKINVT